MVRLLVALAILVAACGDRENEVVGPRCTLTKNDLLSPSRTDQTCFDHAFARTKDTAKLLGELDWVQWKDTTKKLGELKVDARQWYVIAAEPALQDRARLSALQLARRTEDPVFGAEIDLATLRVATDAKDDNTANTATRRLLDNKAVGGAQKSELLAMLARRRDQATIDLICNKYNEAAIAWRCLELAPHLPETLAACGRLPVLSYRDIEKFAPLRNKLLGLRCTTEEARAVLYIFDDDNRYRPEEVTIYSRLALDAPPDRARCLLQEASRACLSLIRNNQSCPVLDSFARYVALETPEERMNVFRALIGGKNTEYARLASSSNRKVRAQAAANLFHFHVLLAETLAASPFIEHPRRDYEMPQYHVARAWAFWEDVNTERVTFADLFTKRLRDTVCDARDCRERCASAYNRCLEECRLDETVHTRVCGSPP